MIIVTSTSASKVNNCFLKNGWDIVKPIDEIDDAYICEDLGQFKKGNIVVDFGCYGDAIEPNEMMFGIYIVKDHDWENHLANFRFKDVALAVRISRVVYSLIDKSTFEVSHKELSYSTICEV